MIQDAIRKVVEGQDLTRAEAYQAMGAVMNGETTPAQISALLIGAKMKGETRHEVAGFASAMREKATPVPLSNGGAIDIVGTGGDGGHSFNISTVAALVVAACGVPVAKHGNRSVSSRCGSADLLEALGVQIELSAEQMGRCVDEIGVGFLFAPVLHRAMKHASAPRKEIGVRTVFNILGPMTNPAGVKRQLVGVYDRPTAKLVAEVFRELGAEHVWVVHSDDGLDEISVRAPSTVFEVNGANLTERIIQPEDFGFTNEVGETNLGGTPEQNVRIATEVLAGRSGIERKFVVANAASSLLIGGVVSNLKEGARMAEAALDSGAAQQKLKQLIEFSREAAE